LYVAGVVESIDRGLVLARETIASGAAIAKLEEFVGVTRLLAGAGPSV
jgi:anthranilate phosphoribosyltransferase